MILFSLLIITFLALPKSVKLTESSALPTSSDIYSAPVTVAISLSISFFLSPNPGALTATTFRVPLNLLTTNVANA